MPASLLSNPVVVPKLTLPAGAPNFAALMNNDSTWAAHGSAFPTWVGKAAEDFDTMDKVTPGEKASLLAWRKRATATLRKIFQRDVLDKAHAAYAEAQKLSGSTTKHLPAYFRHFTRTHNGQPYHASIATMEYILIGEGTDGKKGGTPPSDFNADSVVNAFNAMDKFGNSMRDNVAFVELHNGLAKYIQKMIRAAADALSFIAVFKKFKSGEVKDLTKAVDQCRHQDKFPVGSRVGTLEAFLRDRWPWVSPANRKRAARLFLSSVPYERDAFIARGQKSQRHAGHLGVGEITISVSMMQKAGVPAVDLAGPWVNDHKTWVREHQTAMESPTPKGFLEALGYDGRDHRLTEAVIGEFRATGRRPSKERIGQINNALILEREKQSVDKFRDSYMLWARWSNIHGRYREPSSLPDGWSYLKATEQDLKLLVSRTKKYGLCVVDVITENARQIREYLEHTQEMGSLVRKEDLKFDYSDNALAELAIEKYIHQDDRLVYGLIACHEQDRPTICGVARNGICPSAHWCTGINNQTDTSAYMLFKYPQSKNRNELFERKPIKWD